MTDTFRSLCTELTFCWSRTTNPDDFTENVAPIVGRMKAALAQPEPEVLADDDLPPRVGHILRLAEIIRQVDGSHGLGAAALAEAILSHPAFRWRPAIEPVPVSERPWERQGWCDAEERCALFSLSLIPDWPTWIIAPAAWAERFPDIYSHSLPHYALPLPTTHK